ncbi:MAG TPA: DinB family protein [Jatrophihabitans sp.]|jgi:hypothetical protein
MTWTAPAVDRPDPDYTAPERTALQQWLRYHRQTLLTKCAGLSAEQLCERAVPPSTLTLLGLVRHLREVERSWILSGFAGLDRPSVYWSADNPDGDFDDVDPAHAEQDLADYLAELAEVDAAVAGHDLDEVYLAKRKDLSIDLRWIFIHLIEEYARHNGHADLLRQRIDGAVGE